MGKKAHSKQQQYELLEEKYVNSRELEQHGNNGLLLLLGWLRDHLVLLP